MESSESHEISTSDSLRDARAEVGPALEVAEERLKRLIRTAHEDEGRAENELLRLVRSEGVERAIIIVTTEHKRHWHFGAMKGAFLVRGDKKSSLMALAELPDAIREWKMLRDRSTDLLHAYRRALEGEERAFFIERARARSEGREVPQRKNTRTRTRK